MCDLTTTALALAKTGVPVLPLRRINRTPATEHGHTDASTDPAAIARAFSDPAVGFIGVPTGAPSGSDVVDIDPRHGGDVWLNANKDRLPVTRRHITGRGGWHYLFRATPGTRCSVSKIAHGVDVKAGGGYVTWWPAAGLAADNPDTIADWPPSLLLEATRGHPQCPSANILNRWNQL